MTTAVTNGHAKREAAALDRTVFTTSRAMEFFTEKEVAVRMGGRRERWPEILAMELIANGLDASEGRGPPCIEVTLNKAGFAVADNGPGLPAEIIERSLDYDVRVSDKSLYVTPTRGQLGNALKRLWAAPFVAHGCAAASVVVEAGDRKHTVRVSADQIAGAPKVDHVTQTGLPVRIGTSVTVGWPFIAGPRRPQRRPRFLPPGAGLRGIQPARPLPVDGPWGRPGDLPDRRIVG